MSRTVFWITFVLVTLIRVMLAAVLPLFGDEAFYWQESQRLAAGYSDLPAGMAWLLAPPMAIFGHHLLALRLPSVVAGLVTVLLLRAFVRQHHDEAAANVAGVLALLVPIGQAVGVLAIPDAALTLALIAASLALIRAISDRRWRYWLVFALMMALAWLLHWRAAMIYFGGLLLISAHGPARRLWQDPRHWLAQLLGLLGLVPTIVFNAALDWPSVRFQAVDRHEWGFHLGGLQMPLEQALVVSPILFLAVCWAIWQQRRTVAPAVRGAIWIGLGLLLAYFAIGCFADQERTRVHWPWPAWLLLLPALALQVSRSRWRWWLMGATAVSAVPVWLGLWAMHAAPDYTQQFGKRFGANFLGYAGLAGRVRPLLDAQPGTVLIADNFLLGAQLDWYLQQRPYVLDAPRNQEHGRQVQLGIWNLDESGLRAASWQSAILVVDDSALFAADRFPFYQSLCARVGGLQWLGEHIEADTQRQFTIWRVQRGPASATACAQPILSQVFPVEVRPDLVIVGGYAVQHHGRVAAVELRLGDRVIATDHLDPAGPVIEPPWPELQDGNGEHSGFRFELAAHALPSGANAYQLIARSDDGQQRWLGEVVLTGAMVQGR
ncbi:4-amino-4-deoxy-L-arabinose transferase [Ahniella affigens]|uniref:4-amino-4-deoxy-L-arabinose transferase n=1 Tax=Ahniella affigens TaxID=2021234 RepID=A0A2P1PTA3_9GAMM|nr:glycosyltransferase family 39 protein [Ahniella affigens]AVP98074.1 4-amino-4-deoxy-L-arabinose transferase [Ahniella affigens]